MKRKTAKTLPDALIGKRENERKEAPRQKIDKF